MEDSKFQHKDINILKPLEDIAWQMKGPGNISFERLRAFLDTFKGLYDQGLVNEGELKHLTLNLRLWDPLHQFDPYFLLLCIVKNIVFPTNPLPILMIRENGKGPLTQMILGRLHKNGLGGLPEDFLKAEEYYKKSIDQDFIDAYYQMGILCHEAQKFGEASSYYVMAAKKGLVKAYYALGCLYKDQRAGENFLNYKKSLQFFLKGDSLGCLFSGFELTKLYADGFGVSKNLEIARHWLKKSASHGNRHAQYYLGEAYLYGDRSIPEKFNWGFPQNYEASAWYFQKAANQNLEHAKYKVGRLSLLGLGIAQNHTVALDLLNRLTALGYQNAQFFWDIFIPS